MAYFGLQLHPDVATGIPPLQVTAPISQVQSLVLGRDRERHCGSEVFWSRKQLTMTWPGLRARTRTTFANATIKACLVSCRQNL